MDWLLARKRSQTTSSRSSSGEETPACQRTVGERGWGASLSFERSPCAGDATQADDKQDPLEKAVTLQLGTLVTALSELVQTPLMLGTSSVTLLRALTRTYGTLTTLAKHVGSEHPRGTAESFLLHDIYRVCSSTFRRAAASRGHCRDALRSW